MTEIEAYKRLFEEPPYLVLRCRSEADEHGVEGVLGRSTGVDLHFILFRLYHCRALTTWESGENVWYGWKGRWG